MRWDSPADYRAMLARCHALAIAARATVEAAPPIGGAAALTADERLQLQGVSPSLVAAIERAFRWIPIGGAAPPAVGRAAGGAPARPGRIRAVADLEMPQRSPRSRG